MTTRLISKRKTEIVYPMSTGRPIADNTKQFRWIMTIQGGLDALFRDRADVFVAGDFLWYPVEGKPKICAAPDILVVFGRPKHDRNSYLQWLEENIAPQVVFEILSPRNTKGEMAQKFLFYERYGAQEYYLYDPDHNTISGWQRIADRLEAIPTINGWISPLLGIRFVLLSNTLEIYRPDGERFVTYLDLEQQLQDERQRVEQERRRAEEVQQYVERERQRVREEQQRTAQERQQAAQERQRAERLTALLHQLGIDPNTPPDGK